MDNARFPATFARPLRDLMKPLRTSADGMSVQSRFAEIIARNIANAQTTRTPEGGPYVRRVGVVESGAAGTGSGPALREETDPRPGSLVYDPGHPDADAAGYVRLPNVDVQTEIVDLMLARRLHEANATVFHAAKGMLRRALEI